MYKIKTSLIPFLCLAAAMSIGASAHAADLRDTPVSWRHGTDFSEPFHSQDSRMVAGAALLPEGTVGTGLRPPH